MLLFYLSSQNAIVIHWVQLHRIVINTTDNALVERMCQVERVIDVQKVFGILNQEMVAKVVHAMRLVALISHAMHTPDNVIANRELVDRHVTLVLKTIMDSLPMDVNVSWL